MRRNSIGILAFMLGVTLLLVFVSGRIGDRTRIAERGQVVLMRIVPPGPRALSLGDRIEPIYDVPEIEEMLQAGHRPEEGAVVFALDPSNIARFERWYEGGPLTSGEVILDYQFTETGLGFLSSGRPRLTFGDKYFVVTGGRVADYLDARYAMLKVSPEGTSIVTGFADGDARPIIPGR